MDIGLLQTASLLLAGEKGPSTTESGPKKSVRLAKNLFLINKDEGYNNDNENSDNNILIRNHQLHSSTFDSLQ